MGAEIMNSSGRCVEQQKRDCVWEASARIALAPPPQAAHLAGVLSPSIFPSIRVFSNESALHIKWPKCWTHLFQNFPQFIVIRTVKGFGPPPGNLPDPGIETAAPALAPGSPVPGILQARTLECVRLQSMGSLRVGHD